MTIERATTLLVLTLLLGTVVVPGVRAQETVPTPEALEVLHEFLFVDCGVGEEHAVMSRLLEHAAALEPELDKLMLEGPNEVLIQEVTVALERNWQLREEHLGENPLFEFDDETFLAVTGLTRDAFIEQGLRDFGLVTREKAISALAGMGTRSAQRKLRRALTLVEDGVVHEMIRGALAGQRLLERHQPAAQRGPSHRTARPGNLD